MSFVQKTNKTPQKQTKKFTVGKPSLSFSNKNSWKFTICNTINTSIHIKCNGFGYLAQTASWNTVESNIWTSSPYSDMTLILKATVAPSQLLHKAGFMCFTLQHDSVRSHRAANDFPLHTTIRNNVNHVIKQMTVDLFSLPDIRVIYCCRSKFATDAERTCSTNQYIYFLTEQFFSVCTVLECFPNRKQCLCDQILTTKEVPQPHETKATA